MDINKTCCFFGHREVTHNIRPKLTAIIEKLITVDGVTEFEDFYKSHSLFKQSLVKTIAARVMRLSGFENRINKRKQEYQTLTKRLTLLLLYYLFDSIVSLLQWQSNVPTVRTSSVLLSHKALLLFQD